MQQKTILFVSFLLLSCGQKPATAPQQKKPAPAASTPTSVASSASASAPVAPTVSAPKIEAKPMQAYASASAHCEALRAPEKAPPEACVTTAENDNHYYSGVWKADNVAAPYTGVSLVLLHRGDDVESVLSLQIETKDGAFGIKLADMQPMMMSAGGGTMSTVEGVSLSVKDAIPGGALEVIFEMKKQYVDTDDAEALITQIDTTILCGVGPSGKPACLEPIPTAAYLWHYKNRTASEYEPPEDASRWRAALSYTAEGIEIGKPTLSLSDVKGLDILGDDPEEPSTPGPTLQEDGIMKKNREAVEKLAGKWAVSF